MQKLILKLRNNLKISLFPESEWCRPPVTRIASPGSHPGPPPPGQACPRRSTHRGLGAAAPPRRRSAAPAAASFSSSSFSSSSSPGRRPAGSHARGCGGPSRPGRRTAESRRETGPRPHAGSARRRRTGRGRHHRPPRSRGPSRAVPEAPGPTDADPTDADTSRRARCLRLHHDMLSPWPQARHRRPSRHLRDTGTGRPGLSSFPCSLLLEGSASKDPPAATPMFLAVGAGSESVATYLWLLPPTPPPFLCFIARKHRESHSPYHKGISESSWFGPTASLAHHK